MDRRTFLGSLAAGMATPLSAASRPPNIILILADDLGYGDLGCYGQDRIATPNLDRLAGEGMLFRQAYAGSCVCAPSRCSLMTGLHTGHSRIRDNQPHGVALLPDDVTIAELLKTAAYRTGMIGKWHIGDMGTRGTPLHQGFDEFFGYVNGDHAHFYYPQFLWENDEEFMLKGNRGGVRMDYSPDLFTERAIEFVDRHKQHPFFLYLPYILPHWSDYKGDMSLDVPVDQRYESQPWPEISRRYASMVTRLDAYVGRILETVKKHGLERDTLILFTSDNGPSAERPYKPAFFRSAGPFRGTKRDMYEGGVRVPLIARWLGKIAPGATSEHACAAWDILPTLAEVAGVPVPTSIDGISFLPELTGGTQKQHDHFYWEYGNVRDEYRQGIRVGNWKGVRVGVHNPLEVYDLSNDIGETRNLAAERPDIAQRLEGMVWKVRSDSPDYPIKGR